jgi:molybdopterin converting factor small subunit
MAVSGITVEFYGIPRKRAGQAAVSVRATNISELLRAIRAACPGLDDLCDDEGALSRHYLLSLNGERFVAGTDVALADGARVLLLSADPGG